MPSSGTDVVKKRSLTDALEGRGGAGQEELVLHLRGLGAFGDARLDVVSLDPLGQPLHVAVAVEGVGAEGAAIDF